jgi:hypothetical protein
MESQTVVVIHPTNPVMVQTSAGLAKSRGKSVSETFSCAVELRQAQREVEAFHRFRLLSQEPREVKEKICRARPVADTVWPEEKKRRKPSSRKSRAK